MFGLLLVCVCFHWFVCLFTYCVCWLVVCVVSDLFVVCVEGVLLVLQFVAVCCFVLLC